MKVCAAHWAALLDAAARRGLRDRVSCSPATVLDVVDDAHRDPVAGAFGTIASLAVQHCGIQLVYQDGCPLCAVAATCAAAEQWIEGCMAAEGSYAQDLAP